MTQTTSKRSHRAVLSITTTHKLTIKWSDFMASFDQFPIMVSPLMNNSRVYIVMMDGGSSLSVIYLTTLDALQVLKMTHKIFYGIGSEMKGQSVGQITLHVTFGDMKMYQMEKIVFKVVDFKMDYNAIIGRPSMEKFMCVPHYTYQLLKMLGPHKIIRVQGSPESGV